MPFYFAPQSPMLYRIAVNSVEQYQDGQDPLVYLVTTVGAVHDAGLPWVFSNGNCGAATTEYFDDLALLDTKVDWEVMDAAMWAATAEDPGRPTRRCAEFLVHRKLPWRVIRWLTTRTEATATQVRELLGRSTHRPQVVVRPGWYYNGQKYR